MNNKISQFLKDRIAAGDFPSAVYLVAEKGGIVFQDALGYAVIEPERIEARVDTIYDLASLTKPLVTGLLMAMLIEGEKIDPNARIGNILPEFHVSSNAEISINQLLSHISGLPAWRPFYLLVEQADQVAAESARTLQGADQEPVTYSDLNFFTLAAVIEHLIGNSLDQVVKDEIISPLGLRDTCFNPLASILPTRIAASEKGNDYEKQTCIEMGYIDEPIFVKSPLATASGSDTGRRGPMVADNGDSFFRNYQIWGEVHDGNAWFMGGVAGHAGLFSIAEEVFKIALQFLPNYTTLLKPETCELFRTNFTEGMNEDRSIAFQLASTEGSTAGSLMSRESFGHNGFTGTSLWIDPVKERIFVLLTNRTHAHPLPFVNINSVRRRFHDMAVALLDENN
jgi:CubicO group peptidase (beta-lactamase class C family)